MEFIKTVVSIVSETESIAYQPSMMSSLGNNTFATIIPAISSLPKFQPTPIHYATMAMLAVPIILSFHPDSFFRKAFYHCPILLLIHAYTMPRIVLRPRDESYQFGVLVGSWFMRILDRLYFNEPEKDFFRKDIDDVPGSDPTTYNPTKKFLWASELILVTRGVGWNWEVPGIEKQIEKENEKTMGSAAFVRRRILKASCSYLILYVIVLASRSLSDYAKAHQNVNTIGLFGRVLCSSLCLRTFIYTGWFFVVFSTLSLAENLLSILFVGTGMVESCSQPSAWPTVFGNVSEGYSFRRFWGKWWHQNFRRICSSPGDFIIKSIPALCAPKSSSAFMIRRYLRVFMTFASSAFVRSAGSFYVSRGSNAPTDGKNFQFFLVQAVFLLVEDLLCWLLEIKDDGNPSYLRRAIGYTVVHSYGMYAIPNMKVIPLAHSCVHGEGNPMIAGVIMTGLAAQGVMRNPFRSLIGSSIN